jgi:hypothetical protein
MEGGFLGLALAIGCGRADAGDDVLALGVHQELAVEQFSPVAGVAGEGDAGAGVVAHVAEDHRLDVDRGAPLGRDVVLAAVDDRALVHPGAEDGADRAPELLPRDPPGRSLPVRSLTMLLEALDELLEVVGVSSVSNSTRAL